MLKSNIPGYTKYFLSAEGKVFNIKTGKELKMDRYNYFLSAEGICKRITLKNLYKLVYNKVYCIDNIENLEGEEWKEIEDSQGVYFISNYGRIKTYTEYHAKLIKPYIQSNYEKVKLVINNTIITSYIHRLVGLYWLDRAGEDCIIHHINGNGRDNRHTNLIWLTPLQHTIIHNTIAKKKRFLTAEETKSLIKELEKGEVSKYELDR